MAGVNEDRAASVRITNETVLRSACGEETADLEFSTQKPCHLVLLDAEGTSVDI